MWCSVGCWPVGVSGVGGYGAVSSYKYGVLGEAVLAGERSNSSYTLQQGCRVGHSTSLYTTGLATVHGCTLYKAVHYVWLYTTGLATTHGCTVLQTAPFHSKPATGSSSYILQARTVHAQGNMQHLVFHLVVHWHVAPCFATLWRATL